MTTRPLVVLVLWLLCLTGVFFLSPPAAASPAASPDTSPIPPIPSAGLSLAGEATPPPDGCDPSRLTVSYERPEGCRSTEAPAPPRERPNRWLTAGIAAGAVLGSAANSFTDGSRQSYHFTQEGWFGQHTYTGGADKASHFVSYYLLSKELANLYRRLGHSERDSIWLGLGVATATGLMTEIGDGTTEFGFSHEDLLMDVFGASIAALIAHYRADDLVGFRVGFLEPRAGRATCCQVEGLGRDYSNEIYTGDLKLSGLARRLGVPIGPLKYLLLSVTYGTKGYPTGLPADRERQLGIEIGLNFQEILNDLNVSRNPWWGYLLHVVADNVRFPFTSVGMRYDLNRGRWCGPNNGNTVSCR